MTKIISKHILEVRYKSNSRFLDRRGEIADMLSGKQFDQWNISNNRIDFASKKHADVGAFFSYRNFGFFSEHPNSIENFNSETKKNFKECLDLPSN